MVATGFGRSLGGSSAADQQGYGGYGDRRRERCPAVDV